MKISHLAWAALLSASAACIGYWFHWHSQGSESFSAAKSLPRLEDLIVHESFSLVENAKKDLEGLRTRFQLDIEGRLLEQETLPVRAGASGPVPKAELDGIIHDLESGMIEFQGTDEELYLAEDLFRTLKKAERSNRWVELYLRALYEHPTHPAVAHFAGEAFSMGQAAGRADEIIAGLTHLSMIPLDFPGKAEAEIALIAAKRKNNLVSADMPLAPAYQ